MWIESQQSQADHSDLLNVTPELSPLKSRKWHTNLLFVPCRSMLQQCGTPIIKNRPAKWKKVQRRAAWWTLNDYARTTSVTSLLSQLSWQTIEEKRSVARLCLFYKIMNGLVAVPLHYIQYTHMFSRYCHSTTFRQIHTVKDYFKYSFFSLAAVQWNALPANVVVSPSLEVIKAAVGKLQHPKP